MGRRISSGVGGSSNLGSTYIVGSELSPTLANANLTFSPNGSGNVVIEVPNNTTRGTFSSTGLAVVGAASATSFTVGSGGVNQITETITTKTGATGTVAHDYVSEGAVFWHTSPAGNFTANFTSVPTTDNRNVNFTIIIVQGATGRYPSAVQINGTPVTIRWASNVTPTPTSSSGAIDIASFSLFRVGSTNYCVGVYSPFA
jgi:hypothetical protein